MRIEDFPLYTDHLPDMVWFYQEHGQSYLRIHEVWSDLYLRTRLSERQNHRCCYCGIHMTATHCRKTANWRHTMMTLEHVVPKSEGGSDDESNLVAACQACNSARQTFDAYSFAERGIKYLKTG